MIKKKKIFKLSWNSDCYVWKFIHHGNATGYAIKCARTTYAILFQETECFCSVEIEQIACQERKCVRPLRILVPLWLYYAAKL